MRKRLTRTERRAEILETARRLIGERGYGGTEMEDVRLACGMSRGGLYHHFPNKRAILNALVETEVAELVDVLARTETAPIPALLRAGSHQFGGAPGVLAGLQAREERLDYLSGLGQALTRLLLPPLRERLDAHVRPGTDPGHVAELFLIVNAHINRREILGDWTNAEAAGFAATALAALTPFLVARSNLDPIIAELKEKAATS